MKIFTKENKKIFLHILSACLLLAVVLIPFFVSAQQATTQEGGEKCGWTNMAGCIEQAWGKLIGGIADLILSLAAFVTYAAGTLLDFVIKYTIVDMSANVGVITGINTAWSALRDLANIFFIFILLYAAIATVLQLGGVNTKKIITRVIIIALLINFSLFFTRVMIDVSNALSVGFYNAISGGNGISYAYMQKLLLTTVYQPGNGAGADLTKFPEVGFLGAIFFLIAAFVFLAAAVMFISRFVVLILLMITSAPAFAAMALPNDKFSGDWWKALWSQLIFAPVFFILSWATLQVLDGALGSLASGASLGEALKGTMSGNGNKTAYAGAAAVFANFGIAITFMIVTLTASKKVAGSAGNGINSFVGGVVGGAAFGGAASLGRRFIGGYGARVLRDENLKEKASKGDVGARLALQVAGGATKASFDVRNIKAGGIGGVVSKDFGKGEGKGGFAAYEKSEKKNTEDFAKMLKPEGQLKERIDEAKKRSEVLQKEIEGKQLKTKEEEIRKQVAGKEIQETEELKTLRNDIRLAQFGPQAVDKQKLEALQKQEKEMVEKIREEKVQATIGTERARVSAEIEKLRPLAETTQRRAESAAHATEGQWWSQTRGVRAETIRKTLKEKSKEEKALETIKEGLKEGGGGKEKEDKEEGGEKKEL